MTNLLDLLQPPTEREGGHFYGVVTAIVTNNEDPEHLGRVKLRFPWLGTEDESWWARIAAPMAGPERGICFLPEVDDEVLVAFERGDLRYPYVIGSLWNSRQTPPVTNQEGSNDRRVIVSRSGLTICLDDTSGAEQITIGDADGKTLVSIDVAGKAITVGAQSVSLGDSEGQTMISIDGSGKAIMIDAGTGSLSLSGMNVTIEAQASLKLSGALIELN
jgi:uncharacterized protein involved in type VI secretion and phage assembly